MRSIIRSLIHRARGVNPVHDLPNYFDEEERRLVVRAVVVGVVVWALVYALKTAVHWLFHWTLEGLEASSSLLLVFVPLLIGALIVAALSKFHAARVYYRGKDDHVHVLNDVEGDGLERAIALYYTSEPSFEQALQGQEGVEVRWELPTFSLALRKAAATLATMGSGGSGGLEASVTLIGESISAGLFKPRPWLQTAEKRVSIVERIFRWWQANTTDDLQTVQLCGIAAAVATLLGVPFTAAFFASEVMYRQRPLIEKLIYALISALVAYFLTTLVSAGHTSMFEVELLYVPPATPRYFAVLLVMAIVIAVVSVYFTRFRAWFEGGLHRRIPNVWRRHLLGAALTAVVAIATAVLVERLALTEHGLELVLGTGESVIDLALAGNLTTAVALIALSAKMMATLTTIGSGGSAGLLVPSLFFGTMVAAAFANGFGYEPMMLIIPGMTASLVSIVNVPLAAILFAVEMFGTVYMLPALLVLVVCSLLALNNSIYRTQRETFDKREILPGVGVRRLPIPQQWAGHTLIDIDFRRRFDLNVIGLVEMSGPDGLPHTRLGTASSTLLEANDILVVLGRDEKLDALELALAEMLAETRAEAPEEAIES